jgi:arylsulfatase A-like enzyme
VGTQTVAVPDLRETFKKKLSAFSPILRLVGDIAFAAVTVFSSLYLLVCSIPITYIGFIQHPLFTWVAPAGHVAQILYWPSFISCLLAANWGPRKNIAIRLCKIFIALQLSIGVISLAIALWRPESRFIFAAWPLLYGPNLTGASGGLSSYVGALICLFPLGWTGVVKLSSGEAFGSPGRGRFRISPFLCAGLIVASAYSAQCWMRYPMRLSEAITGAGLSLALWAAVMTLVFLALEATSRAAMRFRNSGRVLLYSRAVCVGTVLYLAFHKIVLQGVGFNDNLSNLYALAFSASVILYVAGSIAHKSSGAYAIDKDLPRLRGVAFAKICLLLACAGVAFFIGLRFARLDWNGVISAVSVVVAVALLLCACLTAFPGRQIQYGPALLASIAVLDAAILGGYALVQFGISSGQFSWLDQPLIEKQQAYDPSLLALQTLFTPAVNDSNDQSFYQFLNQHANIQAPIVAPEIELTDHWGTSPGPKPNIFLFVIDALRRDYLSVYNPKVSFTPSIEAFAKESVVFQDAETLYGGSALAEPAIWTGVREIHKHYPEPLPRMNALSKMLKADGYHSYIAYDFITERLVPHTPEVTGLRSDYKIWQEKEFGPVLSELEQRLVKRTDRDRPVFAYSQPVNVHSLVVGQFHEIYHQQSAGFYNDYVVALENVDQEFGEFIEFLKRQGLYENSIVILTADHGESLGEWGRWGHISIAPEIMQIPLIIHVPERLKSKLIFDPNQPAFLEDITPSLYYLAGHTSLQSGEMYGRSLFRTKPAEQPHQQPDHYLLMSSYLPVFGILSGDQKHLFIVDATIERTYYYDLEHDPSASENKVTAHVKAKYEQLIRQDLEKLDNFYHYRPSSDPPTTAR